jgi:hypothetical protein
MKSCEQCGDEFLEGPGTEDHVCEPAWEVWKEREVDDGEKKWTDRAQIRALRAYDAESAAVAYCHLNDVERPSYESFMGTDTILGVSGVGSPFVRRFKIEGKRVAQYTTSPLENVTR